MTDTIEIELPNSPMNTVTDFTNNLSYTSFSWSKDETKVPDQNQQEAAKDPTATNRWPRALLVLTAVIAVSALGVAVVTEFVLKSECPHNEILILELEGINSRLQNDIQLYNALTERTSAFEEQLLFERAKLQTLAENTSTLKEQLLIEREERAKLQSSLTVSLKIQESLQAENEILKAEHVTINKDVSTLIDSLQAEQLKTAQSQVNYYQLDH
jgi:hypothetical protein